MESGFWEWLIRDSDEKSVRRELVEIGLLYLIFLGIMFFVDDVPLRWVLVAFAAGVVLFWESGREFLRIGLLAAVIVFGAVRPFVIQAFYIPSRSMENTLLVNDHIFVNKFIYYFKNPDRWDVIVFEYPNNPNKDYIKRLVGLPGDTVALSDHRLSINGRPVRKNYLHSETEIQFLKKPKPLSADGPPELLRFRGDAIGINQQIFMKEESVRNPVRMNMSILKVYREAGDHHVKEVHVNGTGRDSRLSDNFGPVKVPQKGETVDLTSLNGSELNFYFRLISRRSESSVSTRKGLVYRNGVPMKNYTVKEDMFFVLGDNRDHSEDSRVWGFVPRERLLGEAILIYWPPSRIGLVGG